MRNKVVIPVIILAVAGFAGLAAAEQADVTVKCGTGNVDWTKRVIVITGVGAPDLKAPNVAVARLGAERVAEMDSLRKAVECLKGVQISGTSTVSIQMGANPQMQSKIEGIIRNWKVVDTRYFSDGGVEKDIEVGLDGSLVDVLMPEAGKSAVKVAAESGDVTGIIIDATALDLVPALSPSVFSDAGDLIYGASLVPADSIKASGLVSYAKGIDAAKKGDRAGQNPLVVKALGLKDNSKSDLVVAAADAGKIKAAAAAIAKAKVAIVTK